MKEMLNTVNASSLDNLIEETIPSNIRLKNDLDLESPLSESDYLMHLKKISHLNKVYKTYIGLGYHTSYLPAVIQRNILENPGWYTAYTPYQPEVSQGTLQYLFEFQTQVALITGMDVANASMYDGATSCAEAALMARRVTRRADVVLSGGLHPHYTETTETLLKFLDSTIDVLPPDVEGEEDIAAHIADGTACVIVQYPDMFGRVRDLQPIADACHDAGSLLVVVMNEVVALGALRSPGDMGADIVAAEGRSIGNPLNFGGPYVGLFATREKFVRQMPGRLAGETLDVDGKRGWVLTLSTREQHIRREKATSNICTNSGLCALAFTIHLSLLGEDGFRRLAAINHAKTVQLADRFAAAGIEVVNDTFFNELTLRLAEPAEPVVDRLAKDGILAGVPVSRLRPGDAALANLLLVAVTETVTDDDMDRLCAALKEAA